MAATLWSELCAALLGLLRSPRYSVPAVLSVALGTGASLAVFSVFSALALRPLPFRDPEQLVAVGFPGASQWSAPEELRISPRLGAQFREYRSLFQGFSLHTWPPARLRVPGGPSLAPTGDQVSLEFFDTLGVRAEQGRVFSAQGPDANVRDVVVLRRSFWLTKLGGAPLIGSVLLVNEQPKLVLGILPDEQALPSFADFWYPVDFADRAQSDAFGFAAVARLAPGMSIELAQQQLTQLTAGLDVRSPAGQQLGARSSPLRESLVQAEREWLQVMLVAVLSFLLLACSNLAALCGTRASERQHERAVRAALGASRTRLALRSLLEAFLVVLLGGALGLGLAGVGIELANQQYREALGNVPARVDGQVFGAFCGLVLLCTVAAALAPLLGARQLRPMQALAGAGRASERKAALRFRELLVALQVAVTVVLLICAGLVLRSMWATLEIDPGFQAQGVATAQVGLRVPSHDGTEASFLAQKEEGRRLVQALLERLRRLPGALRATVTHELPFDYYHETVTLELEPGAKVQELATDIHDAGPEHFETLGIRLLSGRLFTEQDQRAWPPQQRAIVNRSFARQGLGVEDALGHHVRFATHGAQKAPWIEIIGMVESTCEVSLTDPAPPALYMPFFAYPTRAVNQGNLRVSVAVQVAGSPDVLLAQLPSAIHEVLPEASVDDVQPLSQWVADSYARRAALARVLSLLALSATVLSVVGLFGVTSYAIALRGSEIAIRRALGARGRTIRHMVLLETGRVVVLGLLLGLVGSWFAGRLLTSFLFGTAALDPRTYLAVSMGLLLVTLAAALLAARSATRIAPARALAR
jgi:predicted permease